MCWPWGGGRRAVWNVTGRLGTPFFQCLIDADGDVFTSQQSGDVVKVNGTTGDVVWVYDGPCRPSATPALWKSTLLVPCGDTDQVVALDGATGKLLWAAPAMVSIGRVVMDR